MGGADRIPASVDLTFNNDPELVALLKDAHIEYTSNFEVERITGFTDELQSDLLFTSLQMSVKSVPAQELLVSL